MQHKINELHRLITILKNEEGLSDYGVTLLEGYAVGLEIVVKNCSIPDVSNRRELLCAFFKFFRDNGEANIGMTIEQFVDAFLSTIVQNE